MTSDIIGSRYDDSNIIFQWSSIRLGHQCHWCRFALHPLFIDCRTFILWFCPSGWQHLTWLEFATYIYTGQIYSDHLDVDNIDTLMKCRCHKSRVIWSIMSTCLTWIPTMSNSSEHLSAGVIEFNSRTMQHQRQWWVSCVWNTCF